MDERSLKILSLICSAAGLALLFYISTRLESQPVAIGGITAENVGKKVLVCGEITSKRVANNHLFLELQDETGSISFVTFNNTALRLREQGNNVYNLSQNDRICAAGTVDEYPKGSGELEIVYRQGRFEKQ